MDRTHSFGYWLRRCRKALDLTQAELAQRVSCSPDLIQKIEADARRPSRQLAVKLADSLGLDATEHTGFVQAARAERAVDQLALPSQPVEQLHSSSRTNLPAQLTALIGREREVASICVLLHSADTRLVTLTGPGGIGKTRLGQQIAAQVLNDFPDGVSFIDLAPIRDSALVISAIAQTLGIKETGGQPLVSQLKQFLRDKRMLLLLDNFEHMLDAAPLVAELLATTAPLKLLVTSRERLRLRGEKEVAVPPLALPPTDDRRDDVASGQWSVVTQYAAVALFRERALDTKPDFQLTNANAAAVVAICVRLEGMPLAIELAAARLKLLAPAVLLARLSSQLALLTGGARDLPARQQTIRHTIDWSYNLLAEAEQTLFRLLGVFVGGCTQEAAEAVCAGVGGWELGARESLPTPNSQPPTPVLDGLAALVDKSLLRRIDGPGGEARFVMLETIREYAVERLEASGEAERLRWQHAAYLLALAEAEFPDSEHVVRLARMNAEYANLRAALQWAAERGLIETGLRLAIAWEWVRGHVNEGRTWFEVFLRQRSNLPIALQVQALRQAGNLATIQGDYPGAQALLAESLALARGLGDNPGIAKALDILGFTAIAQGDYQQAREFLEESRALFQELGDMEGIATTLLRLGVGLSLQGDYVRAAELYQESLTLGREQGHALLVGWAFFYLGVLGLRQGDARQTRTLLAKSLPVFQEYGDTIGIVSYLEGMAEVAGLEGRPARLVQLFGAAVPLHARFGVSSYPAEQVAYERQLLAARAQLDEATYAAAWAEGQAMTLEQAIAYALGEDA